MQRKFRNHIVIVYLAITTVNLIDLDDLEDFSVACYQIILIDLIIILTRIHCDKSKVLKRSLLLLLELFCSHIDLHLSLRGGLTQSLGRDENLINARLLRWNQIIIAIVIELTKLLKFLVF